MNFPLQKSSDFVDCKGNIDEDILFNFLIIIEWTFYVQLYSKTNRFLKENIGKKITFFFHLLYYFRICIYFISSLTRL